MDEWNHIASDETIEKTANALKANGFEVFVVENHDEARTKILELIPDGSEVMTMTSRTLDVMKLPAHFNESGKFNSIRKKFATMDWVKDAAAMRKLGAAPDYAVGSVQALTEDGHVVIASASGSQLPAYAYGAGKVVWAVGAQKIVKSVEDGVKRVYEESLPLEDVRALKAYGVHSGVHKLLIYNKEYVQGRVSIVIIKEKLGF